MITRDHKNTAIVVAKQIGLTNNEDSISCAELEKMSNQEMKEKLKYTNIFSRINSEHNIYNINLNISNI